MPRPTSRSRGGRSASWAIATAATGATAVVLIGTVTLRIDTAAPDRASGDLLRGETDWGAPWDAVAQAPAAPAADAVTALGDTLMWLVLLGATICALSLVLHAAGWILSIWRDLAIRVALGAPRRQLWAILSHKFVAAGMRGVFAGLLIGALVLLWLHGGWPAMLAPPANLTTQVALAAIAGAALLLTLIAAALTPTVLLDRRDGLATELHGDRATTGRGVLRLQELTAVLQFAALLVVTFASFVLWRELPRDMGDTTAVDRDLHVAAVRPVSDASGADRSMLWQQLWTDLLAGREQVTVTSPGAWLGVGPRVPTVAFCDACFIGQFFTPIASETVRLVAVSPESLTVMGGEVVRGRDLTAADGPGGTPVAMLNETAALRLFPGADSIGRAIRIGGVSRPEHTVVGVVRRPLPFGPGNTGRTPPTVFVSIFQHPPRTIALSAATDVTSLNGQEIVPGHAVTVDDLGGVPAQLRDFAAPMRFGAGLFLIVAVATTAVAAIALVTVMMQQVETRRRELSIRLALGARARDLLGWIMRRAVRLTMVGVVLGITGARWIWDVLPLQRSPEGMFGPLLVMTTAFLALSLLSSILPVRRALRLDPTTLPPKRISARPHPTGPIS